MKSLKTNDLKRIISLILDTLCEAQKDDDGHALNLKGIFYHFI